MYWNSGDHLNEVNKRGRKVSEGKDRKCVMKDTLHNSIDNKLYICNSSLTQSKSHISCLILQRSIIQFVVPVPTQLNNTARTIMVLIGNQNFCERLNT